MVLNIITGSHFSQRKLFQYTNKYFGNKRKFRSLISTSDSNYVVKIDHGSVKIITSNQCPKKDFKKIKIYIETLFKNQSILIISSEYIHWLDDIKNVTINFLE
jgi:hypothetical protein